MIEQSQEPFVCAEQAAQYLGIRKQFLLSLARRGLAGSYAIGLGEERKRWIFRLSELNEAITARYAR